MTEENITATTLDGGAFARALARLMEARGISADVETAVKLAEESGIDSDVFRARLENEPDANPGDLSRLGARLKLSEEERQIIAMAYVYDEEHGIEESFALSPTVIARVEGDRFDVVTAGVGEDEALLVFRSPEEAEKYQEQTGKHQPSEGFKRVHMDKEEIAVILETQGIVRVAMPEPWRGGNGGVDTFTAANFLQFLDESDHGSE